MLKRSFLPVALALFAVGVQTPLTTRAAEGDAPAAIEVMPRRVTMFKNGFGVVHGTAALPEQPGPVRITPLPKSTFGGMWLGWADDAKIDGITAHNALVEEKRLATSIPEMLEANIGRPVTLVYDDKQMDAVVRDIPFITDTDEASRNQPRRRSDILVLEGDDEITVIRASEVKRVRFTKTDTPTGMHVTRAVQRPVLDFNVQQPGKDREVAVEYMASGIAWSPSYRVTIDDTDKATITAKAVIVNDLIDLDGVDVELVTGFPHLEYAKATSGLWTDSLSSMLSGVRNMYEGYNPAASFVNVRPLSQVRYISNRGGGDIPAAPVAGESTEDLYFYPVSKVELAKSERGYYPLFEARVPYEHCYTWDIPDYVDSNNNYRRDEEDKPEIVWHAISLTNTSGLPWTTAPGQTIKAGRVLGQDTLHYTAHGSSTDLRITQALAIEAEQNEYEVSRKPDVERIRGSRYDLVTVRGELALTNHKDVDVTVRITKMLSGEVKELGVDGKPSVTKIGTNLQRVNPRSQVVWNVKVPAGSRGPVKLSYTYDVYVRN